MGVRKVGKREDQEPDLNDASRQYEPVSLMGVLSSAVFVFALYKDDYVPNI